MSEHEINNLTNQHLQLLLDKARDRQRELQVELKLVNDRINSITLERLRRVDKMELDLF